MYDDEWCCRVVEYKSSSDAMRAIRDLHNSSLDGRVIFVREVPFGILLII